MVDRQSFTDKAQRWRVGNAQVAVLCIGATLGVVGVVSRYSLLVVLLDGVAAALVLVPLILGGLALVPLLRLGALPWQWHFLLAATLGIGAGATLVQLLGLIGILHRSVWIGILCASALVGVCRLGRNRTATSALETSQCGSCTPGTIGNDQESDPAASRWLWLLIVPSLSITLLAASHAPGFLWSEEGFGYDVLEYHLQVPKEYLQNGRITYLPHNVYANFPANVEAMYLLAMIAHGDVLEIGPVAQMIHLFLGVLLVYAAWVIASDWSRKAGQITALSLATAGWLGYLSPLAYNENGLLFFGTVGLGCILRALRNADVSWDQHASANRAAHSRWLMCGGITCGLACGCKYTAAPFFALPALMLIAFTRARLGWRAMAQGAATFTISCLIGFAPCLAKNAYFTGNPVFPLANGLFHAAPPGWGPQQSTQWEKAHTPPTSASSFASRIVELWRMVPADGYQRFGPTLLLLGPLGLIRRRRETSDSLLMGLALVQVGIWLFATHLYARFAVPMLAPLALMAGRSCLSCAKSRARIVSVVIAIGSAYSACFLGDLYRRERPGDAPSSLFYDGHVPGFEFLGTVNNDLPGNAKILLVGESRPFYCRRTTGYCVVFNENPLAAIVRDQTGPRAVMEWLRQQAFTHVLVNWSEIRRLRNTYGFPSEINEGLFDSLAAVGLRQSKAFALPGHEARYVELYEVPP